MRKLLDRGRHCARRELEPGAVLLREGERSGLLFVLAESCLEVFRGEVETARVDDPGAVFGETSVLLDIPHATSVRAVTAAVVYVVDNPAEYLATNVQLALPIAKPLARRLQNVTGYLVDLKRQYRAAATTSA